jgi:hypothetical protein
LTQPLAQTATIHRPSLIAAAMAMSVAALALSAAPAFAAKGGNNNPPPPVSLPLCTLADLSPGAAACSGFFQGNLLTNNTSDLSAQAAGLATIGLSNWDGAIVEPQLSLGSSLVNFQTALNGPTWVGIHFGGGANSPSPQTSGGVTAFYRLDAGVNLDTFTLNYGSASGARLYSTGPLPKPDLGKDDPITAVPEPAGWALMILGFGAAGAMLRRRRAALA